MSQDAGAQFAALHEQIQRSLADAMAASDEYTAEEPAKTGTGRSERGEATVTVDGKGLLRAVQFDHAVADLDADELRTVTLDALHAAQEKVRPPSSGRSAAAALHDSTVADQLDAIFTKMKGQA